MADNGMTDSETVATPVENLERAQSALAAVCSDVPQARRLVVEILKLEPVVQREHAKARLAMVESAKETATAAATAWYKQERKTLQVVAACYKGPVAITATAPLDGSLASVVLRGEPLAEGLADSLVAALAPAVADASAMLGGDADNARIVVTIPLSGEGITATVVVPGLKAPHKSEGNSTPREGRLGAAFMAVATPEELAKDASFTKAQGCQKWTHRKKVVADHPATT